MTLTTQNPLCLETGQQMERGVRPLTLSYKGQSITIEMPGWYCEGSSEGVHNAKDMKTSDRALNLLKARVENLLEPDEIRRIRKKLGLTQVQAGERLGGGPRAFQRYEKGDALPSRAICTVLRLLEKDPNGLEQLP